MLVLLHGRQKRELLRQAIASWTAFVDFRYMYARGKCGGLDTDTDTDRDTVTGIVTVIVTDRDRDA